MGSDDGLRSAGDSYDRFLGRFSVPLASGFLDRLGLPGGCVSLMLVLLGVGLRLRDVSSIGLLALVVLSQLATSPIASHMVARASFRAGQVRHDLFVVDDLSPVLDHEEPRGGTVTQRFRVQPCWDQRGRRLVYVGSAGSPPLRAPGLAT